MATITSFSKVFILDKYFTSLYKFWETEKKLQDVTSSNEEANLEQELKQLRSKLVTLGQQINVSSETSSSQQHQQRLQNSVNVQSFHHKQALLHNKILLQNNNSSGDYVNQQQFPIKESIRHNQDSTILESKPSTSILGTIVGTETSEEIPSSESSISNTSTSFKITPISNHIIKLSNIEDLIYIPGALTEDALIRSIQSRCAEGKYHVYMGPILIQINPYTLKENSLTLNSIKSLKTTSEPLKKLIKEVYYQQLETNYPQTIITSGCSGSGKTYTSMVILKELYELAGGGLENDIFKYLTATISVLRSLGTAKTILNSESSRIGHFIEVQITEGTIYRTRVHCYFLDQTRVVKTSQEEKNYHIFYQMLAGLTEDERTKLHLTNHTCDTLRYLNVENNHQNEADDCKRFLEWKSSLALLGIPFLDVVRVLAAVVLLGNVEFTQSSNFSNEIEVQGTTELSSVSALLGISQSALKIGLTTRTHKINNQLVRAISNTSASNDARDSLAKSLYTRTVSTIVRRANSTKKLSNNSMGGTLSSHSTDSNQIELASQRNCSTIGTDGSTKVSKSMTALNNAVRHVTDSFIGILDMFGFEDVVPSHLEHLCINLCAETIQHFYNTHIFKASIESCRDEGIQCDWELDYVDNVPCIDLISSLKTGLLSMLDIECTIKNNTVENYIEKIKLQHTKNSRLIENKINKDLKSSFAIQHYAGKVYYNAVDFKETNRDVIPDDLVAIFHKHRCSFGFASHLFSSELKVLGAGGIEPCPKGNLFRISSTSLTNCELLNGGEPISTLTQDFHTRLDNLLRTLVHSRPHFIRCIKINSNEQCNLMDRHTISKQLRAFQILETVNLMVNGYSNRMRFKIFNSRYKLLLAGQQCNRIGNCNIGIAAGTTANIASPEEESQIILNNFDNYINEVKRRKVENNVRINWAIGKKHVFMSEGARQQLENYRTLIRNRSAILIQSVWKGWYCRKHQTHKLLGNKILNQQIPNYHLFETGNIHAQRSLPSIPSPRDDDISSKPKRPQPIAGTPPPDFDLDGKLVQQTCLIFGLDMERPPPVPPSRAYTIAGNLKLGFPQNRTMKMSFQTDDPNMKLSKGDPVLVIGASSAKRGHLVVDYFSKLVDIPYQYLLKN